MPATYDDANLIIQLVRWSTELGVEDAAHALFAEVFVPSKASMNDPPVRKMLQFGETVGTLVKHDVLDQALLLDLWWAAGAWERVKHAALGERERLDEPRLYENFEALATSQQA